MGSTNRQKNYGYGKHILYAAKRALAYLYKNGHFATRATHDQRFLIFIHYLISMFAIRDARHIKQEHFDAFAQHVSGQFQAGEWSLKYSRNLISSVNVGMSAFRNDDLLYVKPSHYLPNGSNIRTEPPACSDEDVLKFLNFLQQQQMWREYAFVWLIHHFSMRAREAVLADLDRLYSEAKRTGQACILEGTKGGRKSEDRIVIVGAQELRTLQFLRSVRPSGSLNLLAEEEVYYLFHNRVINPLRKMLKEFNIPYFKEIRVLGLIRVYEETTGYPAPVKLNVQNTDIVQDPAVVKQGMKKVACIAGHGRIESAYAYVGKPKNE